MNVAGSAVPAPASAESVTEVGVCGDEDVDEAEETEDAEVGELVGAVEDEIEEDEDDDARLHAGFKLLVRRLSG